LGQGKKSDRDSRECVKAANGKRCQDNTMIDQEFSQGTLNSKKIRPTDFQGNNQA
jgi:hypothetical protein